MTWKLKIGDDIPQVSRFKFAGSILRNDGKIIDDVSYAR